MTLPSLSRSVCEVEGGAINLSIAQVSEVIWCIRHVTSQLPLGERKAMAAKLTSAPPPKRTRPMKGGA